MHTIEVPCDRCDEFSRRLQEHDYVVAGCDPVGVGMCRIRYRRPEEAADAAQEPGVEP
jgi:hypothetical protein